MHPAVLADLELGEVESERLGLPHQMLQLAGSEPRRTRRHERIANYAQVAQQVGSGSICGGLLTQPGRA